MSEHKVGGAKEQREAECQGHEARDRGRRPMAEREARLAAQLRENLKKRKALARSRQHAGREE